MLRIFRFVICAGLFFSAGCASLEPLLNSLITPTPVPTKRTTPTPTLIPTSTLPVEQNVPILRVWLPSEFNPTADNPAAKLLDRRLTKFETQHPGLQIEVRVKTADTEGKILNDLSVTSAAAPGVLPDLVLLSRPDLEAAALKGLLHPIDGLSTSLEDPNWYEYAQQLGHVQNTGYGLPFMGDAMVLVYYPELGTIVNWEDVLASQGQLVFQAGNPDGLTGLSLYTSTGGQILDPQGLPTLEEDSLVRVLTLIEEGRSKKVFPPSLVNVTNETQALQIYRTGSANKGIVWILNYHPTSDGAIAPLPGLDEAPFSYATGWVWALAGSDPENQQLAAKLAEYLVEDDFIAEWTQITGFLPTRPSSIKEGDRTMGAILESAHLIPSSSIVAVLGPLMQEAITRVLSGEAPKDVAANVIQKLK
jgi:multiple sugar transport system substrate-binding protein